VKLIPILKMTNGKKHAEFINYTMKVKFLGVQGKLQEFLRVWGKKGKTSNEKVFLVNSSSCLKTCNLFI
jgi:hypothetical protein